MKNRNKNSSRQRVETKSIKKGSLASIRVYDAGGGEGRGNLRYDNLREEQWNMYRRSLEPGQLTQYLREQELRQTKLVEEIVTLTVNVAREDFPSVAADITIKYPVSAAQSAWGQFLEDIRVALGLEFIECIVDCVDRSPVFRILRLRPRGQYYVRQREDSAVLECINTGKVPVQVSWASTMIINSSKAELVYAGDYHTRMEERVDELIMRPLTKAEEFNASKKILAATSAAEIIEIIDEIMKIQQDAVEDGEVPPDLDVISLHRLALESISRLAQGSVELRDRVTSESVDFILDTIESFRSEVDVVTLALQVVNEFNLSQSIDTADVYNLLLDCIQFFSPEAPDYRPKKIPKRLRPPEEDPLLMGLMSMQASKGGGESTRGGDSRSATHRSDHTVATGAFSTLTGRTDDPTSALPPSAAAGGSGAAVIPDSETVAHVDAAVGLPLIVEKSSEEGDVAATAELSMPTLTLTNTLTLADTRESVNPSATVDTGSEPPIPKPSDAETDAQEKTAHTLPPLPIAQSARSTKPRDKTVSRREARRLAMEEEERERERIRLEAEAAALAEQGGDVSAATAAEQAPNTATQGAISTLTETAAATATASAQEDLTTTLREGRGAGPHSRQGRRTMRAATPGTPSGKQDTKATAAAKTKGWKGTKGSTDSFKPTQTSTSVDATTLVDEKELKRRREKEERKKRREAQQQLKLLALPDVPSTKFQGFAGKLRRSMPLLQSFASLFKVICYSYANRELAFDMGIDEEVAEIALLCGSQPRVLDYCMFIIHVMLSDSFGVGDLMTVYTAELDLDPKTEIRRVTWDFLERSVGFLGRSKIDLENLINPTQMSTHSQSHTKDSVLPAIDSSASVASLLGSTASSKLRGSEKAVATAAPSSSSSSSVTEKPKRAYSVQRSSGKYMFINKELMDNIGVKTFKDRYLGLPPESVVLAVAMISVTVDMDPKERNVANRWLDLWDDNSMNFRVLKKRGKDISGLCFSEYS